MIRPVILVGGEGKRLWPLSTPARPKPFLALTGETSLLSQTLSRLEAPGQFASPIVIGAAEHRFLIAGETGGRGRIVLEPMGRGTAPAAAVGALLALADDPGALILVAPADHGIPEPAAFRSAVTRGAGAAAAGRFVLFGVAPDHPATGYGYIVGGQAAATDVAAVARFVEKPDEATARKLIAEGATWNSGIFLMPAAGLIAELEALAPEVVAAARGAIAGATADPDFLRLDAAAFGKAPSVSLDVAVMEKTNRAAVLAADFAWSDIGAWSAVWRAATRDAAGNATSGRVVLEDSEGCLVVADGPTVAGLGLSGLVVVATSERVLILPKDRDQEIRALVDRASGR
jgi:mannose-1-phosphate guanylyltransferase/mannose-1-phosphate guanylyltransferase/mannose-6-phosphate isomerase